MFVTVMWSVNVFISRTSTPDAANCIFQLHERRLLPTSGVRSCENNISFNPLDSKGNYSATSNNTKLVHWLLMVGLLHLVQRGGAWAGCGPAQSPPRCNKCNSPPINDQCINHCIAMMVRCSVVLMWRLKG